jgi:thioredoxin-dependent peroxiredoxin
MKVGPAGCRGRRPAAGSLGCVTLDAGDTAPAFTLTADDGSEVSLSDFKGQKVILYAYPAAMTPGCTKQACDFRDNIGSFKQEGYAVLGLSPDKPAKLAKFRERDGLTFPLLSDPDKTVLTEYGAYGEKKLYGKVTVGVIRSTFVIDVDDEGAGTLAVVQRNVKATGHVAKLRRDLGLDA